MTQQFIIIFRLPTSLLTRDVLTSTAQAATLQEVMDYFLWLETSCGSSNTQARGEAHPASVLT